MTDYPLVGSCKMGHDDMAILDEQLRVRGRPGQSVSLPVALRQPCIGVRDTGRGDRPARRIYAPVLQALSVGPISPSGSRAVRTKVSALLRARAGSRECAAWPVVHGAEVQGRSTVCHGDSWFGVTLSWVV
jgi:hypothetical protein